MKRLLILALLIIPAVSSAQVDPGSLMQCDWTSEKYVPMDGIVADFQFLDAFAEGDALANQGDMEVWAASGGACGNVPVGFTGLCTGNSTLTQENSKVWKNNSSVKIATGNAGVADLIYTGSLEPNTAYQVSFRYKGDVGAEDMFIQINGVAKYYNFATDAWQAGVASQTWAGLATSWATANLHVVNDAIARPAVNMIIGTSSASKTIFVDDFQVRKLKNTGPRSRAGQYTLSVPVTSDMRFGDSLALLSKPADGPAGPWGTSFDGVDDYMTRTNTEDTFDPCSSGKECQFSVGCKGITNTVAGGTRTSIAKYTAGQISWWGTNATADAFFYISDDGSTAAGHLTTMTVASCYTIGTLNSVINSYRGVSDGASMDSFYCNNAAPHSVTNADYPVFDSGLSGLSIAGRHNGDLFWNGQIQQCYYWNKALDPIDASKWLNPYFPGNNNNRGSYVTACTQAASHATCSATKCRDGTPNACQAEATGAMAIFGAWTELCPYNSFETLVGDDSAPNYTGWTEIEMPGDGTAEITAYRDETKHGSIAVRMKTTGTTSYTSLISTCISATPLATYYIYLATRTLSYTPDFRLVVNQYSDGACGVLVAASAIYAGNPDSAVWSETAKGAITLNAATNSINIYPHVNAPADIIFDVISYKVGFSRTPWVHNAGLGSTTYSARRYDISNTLATATTNGLYPYALGWCSSTWMYDDWSPTDSVLHVLLESPATAGSNNRWTIVKDAANNLVFTIYDSAGAVKTQTLAATTANFTAGNAKYVQACTSNTGTLIARHYNVNNATWYSWAAAAGAGTGIQNGQSTNMYIGSTASSNVADAYFSHLCFAPYNAAFNMCGWGNGIPPFLGNRPY